MNSDFYDDLRWCSGCGQRVRYLLSPSGSYCVQCGSQVRMFSPAEHSTFLDEVRRSRVGHDRESA